MYLCGIGYGGSFHLWQHDSLANRWYPVKFLSGHFDTVEDVAYDMDDGGYVVTVSHDQTCRIFAPTYPTNPSPSYPCTSPSTSPSTSHTYHEVSRPQIHGYDLNCVVLSYGHGDADGHTHSHTKLHTYSILTGGEEKVIRVFEMPKIVYDGLHTLCHIPLHTHTPSIHQAYIPELGLSNKGRELATQQEVKDLLARGVSDIDWGVLPLESQLADFTLWVEVEKLYGHHNDVLCMGMSYDGVHMVSSSKARYGQDSTALLLLWRIKSSHAHTPSHTPSSDLTHTNTHIPSPVHTSYEVVQALPGNTSTVVCLQFSRHNQYLVTGSKDRKLCVYVYDAHTQVYELVLVVSSAHKRIIWDLW
ncbi:WD40 repeat domain-containing protein, partial [archaeon]